MSNNTRSLNITDPHHLEHRFQETVDGKITHSTIGDNSIRWQRNGALKDGKFAAAKILMDSHPDTVYDNMGGHRNPPSPPRTGTGS